MRVTTAERKEAEKEQRRNSIVDAAERLFSTRGYDRVTMEDVASEAKLAKGTLYLYFKNKQELYVAVVIRGAVIMDEMIAKAMSAEKKGLSKTYAGGLAYYEFAKNYPVRFNMLTDAEHRCQTGDLGEAMRAEFARRRIRSWQNTVDAIRIGIADGTIRPDAEPQKTARFIIESTRAMIYASLECPTTKSGSAATRDELVYFTLDMLRHALENKGDLK